MLKFQRKLAQIFVSEYELSMLLILHPYWVPDKNILLLTPHSQTLKVSSLLRQHIIQYFTTLFSVRSQDIAPHIPEELEQWGRFRIDGGGDEFQARGYHKLRSDGRDALFVRVGVNQFRQLNNTYIQYLQYELMVDQDAHLPEADERYAMESQYGQLEFVFAMRIKPNSSPINPSRSRTRIFLLAHILEAQVRRDDSDNYTVLRYEGKLGTGEVVDIWSVQCVVGRIQEGRRWWIVDRATDNRFTYPEFV
jgi:hypothetical protein